MQKSSAPKKLYTYSLYIHGGLALLIQLQGERSAESGYKAGSLFQVRWNLSEPQSSVYSKIRKFVIAAARTKVLYMSILMFSVQLFVDKYNIFTIWSVHQYPFFFPN